ncbi:MAG: putative nucleotidyltransferase with HDIG domain [Planctomycetota bacterium]
MTLHLRGETAGAIDGLRQLDYRPRKASMIAAMETGISELSRLFTRLLDEREVELPPMPATAAQVMQLCQQEDTDAAKLSSVIHGDQVIVSNVLRVANSAAYMGQVPCSSLQQAVSRLGMQSITEIALAVSVRSRLFANEACADMLKSLWQHSVLTGFFTKEIARMRRRNVEIAFLCGLLHDVGKALLLNNVDKAGGDSSMPVADLYHAVHEHHVAAGVLLAEQWKLPDQVKESIACHHNLEQAQSFADMSMTVCLADQLSHLCAPSALAQPVTEHELRAHEVLVGLNLYGDQVNELLSMKERALEVTEGMQ